MATPSTNSRSKYPNAEKTLDYIHEHAASFPESFFAGWVTSIIEGERSKQQQQAPEESKDGQDDDD